MGKDNRKCVRLKYQNVFVLTVCVFEGSVLMQCLWFFLMPSSSQEEVSDQTTKVIVPPQLQERIPAQPHLTHLGSMLNFLGGVFSKDHL